MTLDQAIVDAEYLLRHIRQREAQTFTKRDLFQWTKRHFQQVGDLDLGLRTLVEHNYIRKLDKPEERGVGRPRSTGYAVNPELYSQNPQNSVAVAEF